MYNKFPSAQNYEESLNLGEFVLDEDDFSHELSSDENRIPIPPERSVPMSSMRAEAAVPEFQVRAAFYNFWN